MWQKIMRRLPRLKPQVHRLVYWAHQQRFHTSQSFIKHRLCSCKLITPSIQLLVVWIWNEESRRWFIELIVKTDTHQDRIVSKMEGSSASVRLKNDCCALCRLLDFKKKRKWLSTEVNQDQVQLTFRENRAVNKNQRLDEHIPVGISSKMSFHVKWF